MRKGLWFRVDGFSGKPNPEVGANLAGLVEISAWGQPARLGRAFHTLHFDFVLEDGLRGLAGAELQQGEVTDFANGRAERFMV